MPIQSIISQILQIQKCSLGRRDFILSSLKPDEPPFNHHFLSFFFNPSPSPVDFGGGYSGLQVIAGSKNTANRIPKKGGHYVRILLKTNDGISSHPFQGGQMKWTGMSAFGEPVNGGRNDLLQEQGR